MIENGDKLNMNIIACNAIIFSLLIYMICPHVILAVLL